MLETEAPASLPSYPPMSHMVSEPVEIRECAMQIVSEYLPVFAIVSAPLYGLAACIWAWKRGEAEVIRAKNGDPPKSLLKP